VQGTDLPGSFRVPAISHPFEASRHLDLQAENTATLGRWTVQIAITAEKPHAFQLFGDVLANKKAVGVDPFRFPPRCMRT